jgi:long-chain acyl-CoA synthetase
MTYKGYFMYRNLLDMLQNSSEKFNEKPMFCFKIENDYKKISYSEFYKKVKYLISGLMETGLKKGDRVFIFSDNRLEWMMIDFALQGIGAVSIPRGTDTVFAEVEFILEHSQADYLVVENRKCCEKIKDIKTKVKMIAIDNNVENADFYLDYIIRTGIENFGNNEEAIGKLPAMIDGNNIVTIIYTSGTTGNPKGVMLSHDNFINDIVNSLKYFPVKKEDDMISVLPIWHIFERTVEYTMIYSGAAVYYSAIKSFVNDIKKVRPTLIIVVPRILEAFYDKVQNNISKLNLLKKPIFKIFFIISSVYFDMDNYIKKTVPSFKKTNGPLTVLIMIIKPVFFIFRLISKLLFRSIHEVMGGRTEVIISGGGSLPNHIDRFFNIIGFKLLDGYGMTETSPIICLRELSRLVVGTSGPVIDNMEVRIVTQDGRDAFPGEKGELLVKGKIVMKGYYKNEEATDRVLKDGWFHTGDLAARTYYGDIMILGRIKDTIVLIGGENVEPEKIETYLMQGNLISNAVVVGQNQKRLKALIVPEKEKIMELASEKKIEYKDYVNLINSQDIYNEIQKEIDENVNNNPEFKTFEKIFEFKILPEPFTVGEELTQSLKIKRHVIYEKYRQLIDGMFKKN